MAEPKVYIGLDVGAKRIGVARGNDIARLATPMAILPVDGQEIEAIGKIAASEGAKDIVVGLPRGLDLRETAQTEATREFAQRLEPLCLELHWQDEAGTSKQAEQESDGKGKHLDDKAAAIILQDFLQNLAS